MQRHPLQLLWCVLTLTAMAFLSGCCHGLSPHRLTLPAPTRHPPVSPVPSALRDAFPNELESYFNDWKAWSDAVPASTPNPMVTTALPPSISALGFASENYTKTFPVLLQCMAHDGLSKKLRNYLELLALTHQQQAILSETYHAVDELQHAKKEALPKLLSSARQLQRFQEKYQKILKDPNAAAVNAELSSWLALWQNRDPLGVLPSIWRVSTAPTPQPEPGELILAMHFSALYEERPLEKHCPAELRKAQCLWLHQDFEAPVVASGRMAFLMIPALPRQAQIQINGKLMKPPVPGQPWALPLTEQIIDATHSAQHLSIGFPPRHLGSPILPVCLAAGPEP
ncbi:MAG: hypothetical protein J5654_01455 [Victivallales bacterium]|nr:hypothetical protein [Victivallales bacterium]